MGSTSYKGEFITRASFSKWFRVRSKWFITHALVLLLRAVFPACSAHRKYALQSTLPQLLSQDPDASPVIHTHTYTPLFACPLLFPPLLPSAVFGMPSRSSSNPSRSSRRASAPLPTRSNLWATKLGWDVMRTATSTWINADTRVNVPIRTRRPVKF